MALQSRHALNILWSLLLLVRYHLPPPLSVYWFLLLPLVLSHPLLISFALSLPCPSHYLSQPLIVFLALSLPCPFSGSPTFTLSHSSFSLHLSLSHLSSLAFSLSFSSSFSLHLSQIMIHITKNKS